MLAVLCALSVLSWPARGKGLASKTTLSFASILYLASVALLGPLGAALVGAVSPLAGLRQQQPQQRVFNVAMNTIIAGFAGFVYLWVGGRQVNTAMGPADLMLRVGLPLIPADLAMCLANALLMSGVMRLSRGIPVRRFVATMLTSSGPAYVGYGLIGFLFAVLWVPAGVGPFSALLVLSPSSSPGGPLSSTARRTTHTTGRCAPSSRLWRPRTFVPVGTASALRPCVTSSPQVSV